MSQILQGLITRIESDLPRFADEGRIITNIFDFTKKNITDVVQDTFYFRLADLNNLNDFNISDAGDLNKEVRSSWVGVFQFEKANTSLKYIQYVVSLMNLYAINCIVPKAYSCDVQKVFMNEAKVINPKAEPRNNYPFHLLYISFDVIEETTFRLELSEDCDNCDDGDC